jgi:glycyl-tRNA synthetase alpha subunit
MYTQFGGYFNIQANRLGSELANVMKDMGIKRGAGPLLYIFLLRFLVPAWFSEAIVQGKRNGQDDHYGRVPSGLLWCTCRAPCVIKS